MHSNRDTIILRFQKLPVFHFIKNLFMFSMSNPVDISPRNVGHKKNDSVLSVYTCTILYSPVLTVRENTKPKIDTESDICF